MTDKKLSLSTDEQLKLNESEKRFRAAEIAGDALAMQLEADSKPTAELRKKRNYIQAVEMTERTEAHLTVKLERPLKFLAHAVYTYFFNLIDEIDLRRRLTDRRLKSLEDKMAAVMENDAIKLNYRGPWREGVRAKAGQLWTDKGGLWHANVDTTARPGQSTDWTLAVKSGRTT